MLRRRIAHITLNHSASGPRAVGSMVEFRDLSCPSNARSCSYVRAHGRRGFARSCVDRVVRGVVESWFSPTNPFLAFVDDGGCSRLMPSRRSSYY